MSLYYFYRDDFTDYPRDTEDSRKVVRLWYDDRAVFAREVIADEQCLRIVAERLLVRRLLGIGAQDLVYLSQTSQVEPFGSGTPKLSELISPAAFVAMALIPLSPTSGQGSPVLARLYCVGGMRNQYTLPLDGMDDPSLEGLSWFLAGVPIANQSHVVEGRSWLLAAHLLSRIVKNRDSNTAINLARNFIVTGDVEDGVIRAVAELRKPELVRQYSNFRWIMPKENNMNMPKRKVEKPTSLEEAYSLIESMRSMATHSFFRFVNDVNLNGMIEQYRIGADIYACDPKTGLMPIEIAYEKLEQAIRKCPEKPDRNKTTAEEMNAYANGDRRVKKCRAALRWLRMNNADCATMYYLLARNGAGAAIASCLEDYPINARDMDGMTAMDMALSVNDLEAASVLKANGCKCNPMRRGYVELKNALEVFGSDDPFSGGPSSEQRTIIINAIKYGGLSANTIISMPDITDKASGPGCDAESSIFGVAMFYADIAIAEACLEQGIDVNAKVERTRDRFSFDEWYTSVEQSATPMELILTRNWGENLAEKEAFISLLKKYGASDAAADTPTA